MKPATLLLGLFGLLFSADGPPASAAETQSLPNFVIFLADDHGFRDICTGGNTEAQTPHLCALAREGLTFTHAFVASPSCAPSRAALLTGLMPARNGAEANHTQPREDVTRLPAVLKTMGYETAAFGKVAHAGTEKSYGFETVEKKLSLDSVRKFLAYRDKSRPLCLFVGSHDPHVPWAENRIYDEAALEMPPIYADTPEMRKSLARYYTDVSNMDSELGETVAYVRAFAPKNTLFLYSSDHGAQLPFSKWNLYDTGIRTPLTVVWPDVIEPGQSTDAMVSWIDILSTLIELAGGEVPDGIDGRSFARVLLRQTDYHRDRIFATHSGDNNKNAYPIRAVRSHDFKYIRNLHPEYLHTTHIDQNETRPGLMYWNSWLAAAEQDPHAAVLVHRYYQRPAEELYDLKADPYELHNLADDPDHQERLQELRQELKAWMKEQGDSRKLFNDPHLPEELPAAVREASAE